MKGRRETSIQTPSNDVVLSIGSSSSSYGSTSREDFGIIAEDRVLSNSGNDLPNQGNFSLNSEIRPDVSKISPISTQKISFKIANDLTRRRTAFARSFSNSKSRFYEPPYPSDEAVADQSTHVVGLNSKSPRVSPKISMLTPKATLGISISPLAAQTKDEEDDDDEDVYKSVNLQVNQQCYTKLRIFAVVELIVFFSLMGLLVTSLIDYSLQATSIWSLELWKWCVLFIVTFSGRLVTEWFINVLVYLVERRLLFKKKVLYFIYGLKKSVQIFLWLSFVLVAWILLVIHGSNRSKETTKVLHYITIAIAGCLVGAGIWLMKTLLIKILALSFHVKRFFDRIQESLFHQYVLQTLSGPPLLEITHSAARSRISSRLSLGRTTKDKRVKEEVINVEKLQKMNQEKVCAWTMNGLIDVIRRTKLSTISDTLDFGEDDEMGEQNKEIKSEWEAKIAAVKIFHNVAKPNFQHIEEDDLLRFMKMDEVSQVFPLFDGAIETGKIKKSALKKWVVNAYLERKSLAHSLTDTKTAVDQLNNLASVVVTIVIIVVWNLMMGFLTTKILVFATSQLLLVVVMFGNTVKTVFEAIIFVFVMHPFDVGDRCVIDDVQMVVEEMNILTTIFLRYDNEKISYPNSVLATKPISNFYRSPEMGDSVEFAIDFSTRVEAILGLKDRIKSYIESKPQQWRPSHSVQLKDIVDMDKIEMALYVTHTINFQNIAEKGNRRSDLVLELKKILEELGIRYRLLPQDIHVKYDGSLATAATAQTQS